MEYKKIKIKDEEFYYHINIEIYDYDAYYETIFFKDIKHIKRKKYLIFGDYIIKKTPIKLFNVNFDIKNPKYTKEFTKRNIELAYDEYTGFIERKKQIENGDII